MRLSLAVPCLVLSLAGAVSGALANPASEAEQAVGHFTLATLMAQRCPMLRVDTALVERTSRRLGIHDADLGPGGRYRTIVEDRTRRFGHRLEELRASGKRENEIIAEDCRSALKVFGPKGTAMPGLMVAR